MLPRCALLAEARQRAGSRRHPVLVSVYEPLPHADPLGAFAAAQGMPRAFWEHQEAAREERMAIAGIGAAHTIRTAGAGRFADASAAWADLLDGALLDGSDEQWGGGPLLMGGFSFDPFGHVPPTGNRSLTACWCCRA